MSSFEYTGDEVLDVMSQFAPNRNNGVEMMIRTAFGIVSRPNKSFSICEFGAGRGEFIDRFRGNEHIVTYATDLDETYCARLAERHKAFANLAALPEQMNGIFAIDVLEHIEDDRAALRELYNTLAPNGKLLIYVPARMELYSPFDKAIGHFRRYHLPDLKQKALDAGFEIEMIKYHDFLGYFASFYNKLMTSDENAGLNPKAVAIYDKFLVPTTEFIENIIRKPPIGKNVLLVARKKG
ncbi:MAG: hypothetical protein RI894_1775 [Bacteroidota bacterium]|jgi:SAM-dependent methyltransferase